MVAKERWSEGLIGKIETVLWFVLMFTVFFPFHLFFYGVFEGLDWSDS